MSASNKPLVSVTIPSYNHGQFLPEAIESVLSQTYSNFEVIIVDDGSTDNSLEIARNYAAKHSFIKVYTHPGNINLGISRTADLAIQKATGMYLTPCCSDDIFFSDKLEAQVEFMEENPQFDLIYGFMDAIDVKGNVIRRMGIDISNEEDQLATILTSNPITAPSVMGRKKAFDKVGGHEESLVYSDWEMWIRFAASYKIGFIPKPLVKYRIHGYNTSVVEDHLIHYKRLREMYLFLKLKANSENLGLLSEEKYRRILDEQLKAIPAEEARIILDNFYIAVAEKKFSEAAAFLTKAIKTSPRTILQPRRIVSIFKQAAIGIAKA